MKRKQSSKDRKNKKQSYTQWMCAYVVSVKVSHKNDIKNWNNQKMELKSMITLYTNGQYMKKFRMHELTNERMN